MTRHETFAVAPESRALSDRLDALFRMLARAEPRPSVEERAEAIAIAVASADLLEGDLDRFEARLRAVLVKTPEPARHRRFEAAFQAAFRDASEEDVRETLQVPVVLPRDIVASPPEDEEEEAQAEPPPGALALLWRRVRLPVALVLGALLVIWPVLLIDATRPVPLCPPDCGPPNLAQQEEDPDGGGGPDGPASKEMADLRLFTRIAFAIAYSSNEDRETNLLAVARSLRDVRPSSLSEARLVALLSRRTGLGAETVFRLSPAGDVPDQVGLSLPLSQLRRVSPVLHKLARGAYDLLGDGGTIDPLFQTMIVERAERGLETGVDTRQLLTFSLIDGVDNVAEAESAAYAARTDTRAGPIHAEPVGMVPSWWAVGLAVLLPGLALLWRLVTWRRRQRAWFRRRAPDGGITPHHTANVQEALDRAVGSDARIRAARDLARPLLIQTRRLDPARTALATARNGGRLDPRPLMLRRTPRYVALIITEGRDDHQAQRYHELVTAFRRLRTAMDIYYLDAHGDAVFQYRTDEQGRRVPGPRMRLRDLHRKLPAQRLLVFGSGHVFLGRARGEVLGWARTVTLWTRPCLLTPVPIERWDAREAALTALFGNRMAPASPEGLAQIAKRLAGESASELAAVDRSRRIRLWEADPALLTRHDPPPDAVWERLERELREALGPAGFFWLCAASVYPKLSWGLTLFLGKHLTHRGAPEGLITVERFEVLSGLPWFREGFMPSWVRTRLRDHLDGDERRAVISWLCRRLASAEDDGVRRPEDADFFTRATAEDQAVLSHEHDVVFLETLADHPPDEESMAVARALADQFDVTRRDFRLNEGTIVAGLAAYGAAAVWLAPWPAGGMPLMPGDYAPLLALALGLVSVPLALWLLRPTDEDVA